MFQIFNLSPKDVLSKILSKFVKIESFTMFIYAEVPYNGKFLKIYLAKPVQYENIEVRKLKLSIEFNDVNACKSIGRLMT